MARINVPPGEFEEPYRLYMMAPEIGALAIAFTEGVMSKSTLPVRLRELLRMRIAEINQCPVCLATRVASLARHGLSEEAYKNVGNWEAYPEFTDAERAALEYATKFCVDHLSIDEALIDRLRRYYGDATVAEMTISMANWMGLGRVTQVLGASVSCPITYSADEDARAMSEY